MILLWCRIQRLFSTPAGAHKAKDATCYARSPVAGYDAHARSNIAGIRFQLLYGVLRTFDVYGDDHVAEVLLEGIEDVDVRRRPEGGVLKAARVDNTYMQVKHSKDPKTWSWLDHEHILDNFVAVYRLDREARFSLVTDFALRSELDEFSRYCAGKLGHLPPTLLQKVRSVATRAGLATAELPTFLRRITFERIHDGDLIAQLQAAVIRHFDVTAGNEALFVSHLVACAAGWASERMPIRQALLETERLRVAEWIGLGVENPAVRDRLIESPPDRIAEPRGRRRDR